MSYAEQSRPQNPLSLAGAIAINGSIIAAIMLSPMVVGPREKPPITEGGNILQPKPLPKPDDRVKEDPRPLPDIYTPPRPFPSSIPDDPIRTTIDRPIAIPGLVDGNGTGDAIGTKLPVDPPVLIFKQAVRDPKFADAFQPVYPTRPLHLQIEGSATVRVLVGTDGRVRQANVVRATHPDFGAATVRQALRAWRFKPATRGGQPVEDWQTLSVTFVIN